MSVSQVDESNGKQVITVWASWISYRNTLSRCILIFSASKLTMTCLYLKIKQLRPVCHPLCHRVMKDADIANVCMFWTAKDLRVFLMCWQLNEKMSSPFFLYYAFIRKYCLVGVSTSILNFQLRKRMSSQK